jgi:hypothetical protein
MMVVRMVLDVYHGRYPGTWGDEATIYAPVVPAPYQAGDGPDKERGGHTPGPCCTEKSCGWSPRPLDLGQHRL